MAPAIAGGFTYDDRFIIEDNARVHSLARWWQLFGQSYWPPPALGTLYRPLPMLGYAVQWVVGGGNAALFHGVNVALHAGLAVAVWGLALRLLPEAAALAVGLLFAVHPVHVESVANIVGCSELLMALGTVIAVRSYLRLRDEGTNLRTLAAVVGGTAVAAFSKEQGVLVPLMLLAAEVTLVRDRRPLLARLRVVAPVAVSVGAVVAVYLALRAGAVETWDDAPAGLWMVVSADDRRWTMLGVVPEWLRLLLWPARLAIEYSPPHVAVYREWSVGLLPGVTVVAGGLVLLVLSFRRAPVAAFGLLLAGLALGPVSNILLPTGVILAERTLLLPSVGILLAVGALLAALAADLEPAARRAAARPAWALLAVLVIAGGVRSALRTTVWRDDETLLATAVAETPRSYRPWYLLGQLQARRGNRAAAEGPLRRSIELFPDDYGALDLLGTVYREQDKCGPALAPLSRALRIYPHGSNARASLVACLIGLGRFNEARAVAAEGERLGGNAGAFRRLQKVADSLEVLVRPTAAPLP